MNESRSEDFCRLMALIRPCAMCGIPEPSYPIVSGRLGARVMSVGQSPGVVECREGRPFAGTAGATLFSWLAEAGIPEDTFRAGAYMTSVTKCYPAPDKAGRRETPRDIEMRNCARYLVSELRIIEPAVILAIGKLAIERLLGPAKLESVVGRAIVRRYHSFDALVIPLPHPSGRSTWQYMGENKRLLEMAIRLVARHAGPLV